MLFVHFGYQEHANPGKKYDQRAPQVRLDQDQNRWDTDINRGQKHVSDVLELLAALVEKFRHDDDHGEFGEFRRLNTENPKIKPARGAMDISPQKPNQQQTRYCNDVKKSRGFFEFMVVEKGHREQTDKSQNRIDQLPAKEISRAV